MTNSRALTLFKSRDELGARLKKYETDLENIRDKIRKTERDIHEINGLAECVHEGVVLRRIHYGGCRHEYSAIADEIPRIAELTKDLFDKTFCLFLHHPLGRRCGKGRITQWGKVIDCGSHWPEEKGIKVAKDFVALGLVPNTGGQSA